MAIEILRRRPPSELYPSKAALDLIRHFEGLSLVGYLDPINIPTIGYGRTGPVAVVGKRITLAEADALLDEDVARHAQIVRDQITVPLTQGEFDALTSLVFNLGYVPKSLKACLNGGVTDANKVMTPGSYGSALLQFPRNCRAGGKPLKGLYRRRLAEACLFSDLPWENACSVSVIKLKLTDAGHIDTVESTSLEDTLMRARLDTSRPPNTSEIMKKPWSELIAKQAEPGEALSPAEAELPEAKGSPPNLPPVVSAPPPVQPSGPAVAGPAVVVTAPQPPPPPPAPVIIAPKSVDVRSIPYGEVDPGNGAKNMSESQRGIGMVIVGVGSVVQILTVRLGVGTAVGAIFFDLSRDPVVIALAATAVVAVIGWLTRKKGTKVMTTGMIQARSLLK